MAISLANYPQTGETSNLSEYDDENVSLANFLPSHAKQQALPRLSIFETVVPQQNGNVADKNIHSFNKRNSFPRTVPRNSSYTKRHSMYGDLLSQQTNRNSNNKSSAKMRRRAASFGENSVVCNNNNNKYNNNINNNSLTTTETKKKYTTPLIINIPSKVDKVGSPGSPGSPKPSPKPSPKEKSSPKGTKFSTTQHHIEKKQEILDNNKIEISNNNYIQNKNGKELDKPSLDKKHNRTFSNDYAQNQNNRMEDNNIENSQLISNNNSNLSSQNSKSPFYRHNVTLNGAGGSSTDLRKSMYKEPSFRKRLRKVFSLTNIKQDNKNSNTAPLSASSTKFSSLRGNKSNLSDDNDDNMSVSSSNSDSHSKSGRRRSIINIFSSKSEKKRNKHFKQQQSPLSPPGQQEKQLDDNEKDSSLDETRENDDNKEKQGNGNGNERVDDPDKNELIPSRFSSLQSLNDDGSPNQLKHQNSTSPLYNQFRVNKSESLVKQKDNSSSRPSSLPASAKNKETSTTPRRLSVPAPPSVDNNNNNDQIKTPFVNLGANATRSVPSLVLLRDTDISPAPSTPTSIKKLQFSSTILIHETWTREDYDRRGDQSTCNKLTPIIAQKIKQELNDYKTAEMQVHEDSRNNTHFFV